VLILKNFSPKNWLSADSKMVADRVFVSAYSKRVTAATLTGAGLPLVNPRGFLCANMGKTIIARWPMDPEERSVRLTGW
jgi:hypothetical protein